MQKDWTGNGNSIFKALGASNHTESERQRHDYYATDPIAMEMLLTKTSFCNDIWECACGEKHLSKVLDKHGYNVRSSDIVNRCGNEEYDFLSMENTKWNGDIITNPPYRYATEFVYKALEIIPTGNKVAMFLKLQFLEGKARRELFNIAPPCNVFVFSERMKCAMNGDFEKYDHGSAVAYAWFVWVKGFKENNYRF